MRSRYISMQNFRPFSPFVHQQMPGNLSGRTDGGRTDGQTDGHAAKRSRLVGWTDRPMYRWEEGISGFGRTDGRTDGQPENIMPPAPKGGCIIIWLTYILNIRVALMVPRWMAQDHTDDTSMLFLVIGAVRPLQWRDNGHDGISNHQPHHCLLNRLFRRRSKKTSKLRVTGHLCGEFTGHWWIIRTNGKLRRKYFHLMTSSCTYLTWYSIMLAQYLLVVWCH